MHTPPTKGPGAGVGVGLHSTAAAQARPGMAVNLLFFHVICSQMYYRGRAMLTQCLQVPPCNKRLCVLQRWPRGGGGPARGGGGKGNKLLLYSELACPGASSPQSTCHFWPLKGLKASWSQKQAGVPPCQIRRLNCFQLFFFPFCNKSVISPGTEEPAACL